MFKLCDPKLIAFSTMNMYTSLINHLLSLFLSCVMQGGGGGGSAGGFSAGGS